MRKYLYIALGGAAGAVLRYLVKLIPIADPAVFPANTLITNIAGCFVLTLFAVLSLQIMKVSAEARLGITVGLLGGFTTFSTFCMETAALLMSGSAAAGAIYFVTTPLLGIAAGYLGMAAAGKLIKRISLGKENGA